MQLIFFIGSGQAGKLGHLTLQSFMLFIFRFSLNPWCSGLWRISAAWSAKDSSRSSSKSATCGYKKRTFFISCQSRLLRSETVVSCVWNQVFIDETLKKAQLAEGSLTMLGKILSFCGCLRFFLLKWPRENVLKWLSYIGIGLPLFPTDFIEIKSFNIFLNDTRSWCTSFCLGFKIQIPMLACLYFYQLVLVWHRELTDGP